MGNFKESYRALGHAADLDWTLGGSFYSVQARTHKWDPGLWLKPVKRLRECLRLPLPSKRKYAPDPGFRGELASNPDAVRFAVGRLCFMGVLARRRYRPEEIR